LAFLNFFEAFNPARLKFRDENKAKF